MSDMGDVDDETKRLGVIGCLMVVAGLAAPPTGMSDESRG